MGELHSGMYSVTCRNFLRVYCARLFIYFYSYYVCLEFYINAVVVVITIYLCILQDI